jgi:hypothetical protein
MFLHLRKKDLRTWHLVLWLRRGSNHVRPSPSTTCVLGINENIEERRERRKEKQSCPTHQPTRAATSLHDGTAVLLEEANDLGQVLLDLLFVVRLLCSLLLLLMLLLVVEATAERVGSLILRLSMLRLVVLLRWTLAIPSRRNGSSASEVDVDSTFIVLSVVLETLLLADLLYTRLDLLDVVDRVIALADNAAVCH